MLKRSVWFWLWVTVLLLITGGALLVEVAVQQNYRGSANDPQIELARDLAVAIKNQSAQCNNLGQTVDITQTLTPFYAVFTHNGQLRSSVNNLAPCFVGQIGTLPLGQLADQPLRLPSGVFNYAAAHGEDHFTWQPRPGLRFAGVLVHYQRAVASGIDGYVFVARSLKEVEIRERQLGQTVLLSWLVGLLAATTALWLARRADSRH